MSATETIKAVSNSTKVLVTPVILVVLLIILFSLVLKTGVTKLMSLNKSLAESKKEEIALSEKLSILNTSKESALSLADLSVVAIPQENPALVLISQFKKLATERGLALNSIDSKPGSVISTEEIVNEEIEFNLDGPIASIFDFLKSLQKISPLVTLHEVKISQTQAVARSKVTAYAYYAAFPEVLPSISTPLSQLSAEEKDILAKISSFSQPTFSEISPSGPYQRSDLFNF